MECGVIPPPFLWKCKRASDDNNRPLHPRWKKGAKQEKAAAGGVSVGGVASPSDAPAVHTGSKSCSALLVARSDSTAKKKFEAKFLEQINGRHDMLRAVLGDFNHDTRRQNLIRFCNHYAKAHQMYSAVAHARNTF